MYILKIVRIAECFVDATAGMTLYVFYIVNSSESLFFPPGLISNFNSQLQAVFSRIRITTDYPARDERSTIRTTRVIILNRSARVLHTTWHNVTDDHTIITLYTHPFEMDKNSKQTRYIRRGRRSETDRADGGEGTCFFFYFSPEFRLYLSLLS